MKCCDNFLTNVRSKCIINLEVIVSFISEVQWKKSPMYSHVILKYCHKFFSWFSWWTVSSELPAELRWGGNYGDNGTSETLNTIKELCIADEKLLYLKGVSIFVPAYFGVMELLHIENNIYNIASCKWKYLNSLYKW